MPLQGGTGGHHFSIGILHPSGKIGIIKRGTLSHDVADRGFYPAHHNAMHLVQASHNIRRHTSQKGEGPRGFGTFQLNPDPWRKPHILPGINGIPDHLKNLFMGKDTPIERRDPGSWLQHHCGFVQNLNGILIRISQIKRKAAVTMFSQWLDDGHTLLGGFLKKFLDILGRSHEKS